MWDLQENKQNHIATLFPFLNTDFDHECQLHEWEQHQWTLAIQLTEGEGSMSEVAKLMLLDLHSASYHE